MPKGLQEVKIAKIAQLVEHDLAKVGVAGSSPVFRSTIKKRKPACEASGKTIEMSGWRNW